MEIEGFELQHLKRVSRIKHHILTRYLPPWAEILKSASDSLYYVDCFAGPGIYESEGAVVAGSPIIAVKAGKQFAEKYDAKRLGIVLVEENQSQLDQLIRSLSQLEPYPANLRVSPMKGDSQVYAQRIVEGVRKRDAPAFFMIDPYGHPLNLSTMNEMLGLNRSELLINLMWFRINADLANPLVQHHVTELFGDELWRDQLFMKQRGAEREEGFLKFFCGRLSARYVFKFRIRFDANEDRMGNRTKYYLLHATNSIKAVLLMKEVMWPLGDEAGTFEFSGSDQSVLISETPDIAELKKLLLRRFAGQELSFDAIRAETWEEPFIDRHYRSALQELRSDGIVKVTAVTSKGKGLSRQDRVRFPERTS